MRTVQEVKQLLPYFEVCFIFGFGICEGCSHNTEFSSSHPQFSDDWWLDEAAAMRAAGWVVPEEQIAYCMQCALALGLRHDPDAHALEPETIEQVPIRAPTLSGN